MKYKFDFLQTGGVPLTNDLMALIEEAFGIFEVLGDLAGSLTILSGCNKIGNNVNPGIVAINGKLYEFLGGQDTGTVYIHEQAISKTFQNTETKTLIYKKTVQFGNSATTYNWADFVKLKPLKEIQVQVENSATKQQLNAVLDRINLLELKTAPIENGGIAWVWRKPLVDIPAGWKECTDFRHKTIYGWDPNESPFNVLNSNVGSKTAIIQQKNLPNINIGTNLYYSGGGYADDWPADNIGSNVTPNEVKTKALGDGEALDILNPGRIVLFIEPNFN
ncbi:hypothetical protein [Chryseobacterium oncorhynchi]|uniref:Uncharacterized protein n=1 Tax=Chryseobacterium oncorhynchi TaxID=741074 RepID=A0A316WSX4_9FLAO|nr:hypothetical protein [Chryseobacterium oncorhynchi]PWN62318.1 hypothetical protein C1638_017655 [Chryseobacterium oncorhynchi]